jgi:hypothetical protein
MTFANHHSVYLTVTRAKAYLHHPTAEVCGGATIHPEFTLPRALYEDIAVHFGPWPD